MKTLALLLCLLQAVAASDTLLFLDGGGLQGKTGEFEDGLFFFQPTWSGEPVPVRMEKIGSVVFAEPEMYPADGRYVVLLKNGDRFYGEVLAASDEEVTLRTSWSREVTLPRKHVVSLHERPPEKRSLLTVPIERHATAVSRTEEGFENNALQEVDALYLSNPWNLSVPLPKLPERSWLSADLSFDVVSFSRGHMVVLTFFASRPTPAARDGLRLALGGEQANLQWYPGRGSVESHLIDVEMELLENGRLLLQVETDLRENEMRIFANGEALPPFRLRNVQLEADGDPKHVVLAVRNPAVRVHGFEFGEGALPDPEFFRQIAAHPGDAPPAAPKGAVRVRLTGGRERLTLLPTRLTGGVLRAKHPFFKEEVVLPRENISVLQFNADTLDRKDRAPRPVPPVRMFPSFSSQDP